MNMIFLLHASYYVDNQIFSFPFYLAVDGQIISGQNSQGLLIPAASIGQVASSSTAASLSTSVVPTSAIQSVMTTQIQVCT